MVAIVEIGFATCVGALLGNPLAGLCVGLGLVLFASVLGELL